MGPIVPSFVLGIVKMPGMIKPLFLHRGALMKVLQHHAKLSHVGLLGCYLLLKGSEAECCDEVCCAGMPATACFLLLPPPPP